MKKILLSVLTLLFSVPSFSEPPNGITQLNATVAAGGINVNVHVVSGGVIAYVANSYTIIDSEITLEICYYPYPLPEETELSNDFFIPITQANNYNITYPYGK